MSIWNILLRLDEINEIDFGWKNIKDEGIAELAVWLPKCTTLHRLRLYCNNVTSNGV